MKGKPTTTLRRCSVLLYQIAQLTEPEISAALRNIAAVVSAMDSRFDLLATFGGQSAILDRVAGDVNELVVKHPDYDGLFKPDDGRIG